MSDANREIKNRKRLRDPEQVLVLGERLKKKDEPGRLYKTATESKPFFRKDQVFLMRKRVRQNRYKFFNWVLKKTA